jgi:hypothetical protein
MVWYDSTPCIWSHEENGVPVVTYINAAHLVPKDAAGYLKDATGPVTVPYVKTGAPAVVDKDGKVTKASTETMTVMSKAAYAAKVEAYALEMAALSDAKMDAEPQPKRSASKAVS